jgi:DNA-binding transcriptional regulator YiaG
MTATDCHMTPAEVRAHRQTLGMTQAELAAALRLASDGKRTVRHWETEGGKFQITGPASVALELMVRIRELDQLATGSKGDSE